MGIQKLEGYGRMSEEEQRFYENTKTVSMVDRICFAIRAVLMRRRAVERAEALMRAMKEAQEARESNEVSEV